MIMDLLLSPWPTSFRLLFCVRKNKYFLKSHYFCSLEALKGTSNIRSHSFIVKIERVHPH